MKKKNKKSKKGLAGFDSENQKIKNEIFAGMDKIHGLSGAKRKKPW